MYIICHYKKECDKGCNCKGLKQEDRDIAKPMPLCYKPLKIVPIKMGKA